MGAIKEFFSSGGEFMWPILAVSVVGIAIIAERVARLFFRYSVNANQFMAQIQKLVISGNIDRAIKLVTLSQMQLFHALLRPALPAQTRAKLKSFQPSKRQLLRLFQRSPSVHQAFKRLPTLQLFSAFSVPSLV